MVIHNLPGKKSIALTSIPDTPFLKMFMSRNSIHEPDRERATSIMANLRMAKQSKLGRFSHIFKKRLIKEEKITLA